MKSGERKQLADHLVKETKRLKDAIRKAEKKGELGRIANYRQSLEAYQNFLESIYNSTKKPLVLIIIVLFTVLALFSSSEATQNPVLANNMLDGKIFSVNISLKNNYESKMLFYISFKKGKLHFSKTSNEYYHLSKFRASYFYAMADSTHGGTILFSSQSINRKGETLLWLGSVEGDRINGTLIWTGAKKGCTLSHFTGSLKYLNNSEGNF